MYCPIYKIGTTFWRRVYMIEGSEQYKNLINPYDIAFDKDFASSKFTPDGSVDAFTYMFVREPYGRLFSFYVDKLMASNPYYWKVVGIQITKNRLIPNKCGHDVTFSEFIKYAVSTLSTGKDVDPHWVEMEKNCRTCDILYDYIGKMETFAQNADEILHKLRMNKTAEVLKEHGSVSADEDAIKDAVTQPYAFKTRYGHCISFTDATKRAWTKLQIRGLVGSEDAPKNLTYLNSSWRSLFNIAKTSSQSSTKAERKQMKTKAQRDYWAQVDVKDLYALKRLYAKDFQLFGYDDHPEIVFQGRTLNDTDQNNNSSNL